MGPASASRTLWVVRHGKAAAEPPGGGRDRDRPLVERGRSDAHALGRALAHPDRSFALTAEQAPTFVLCSAATRTHETAAALANGLGGPTIEAVDALYGADAELVLRYVSEIDDRHRAAVVVGHNPTMHQLAWELCDDDAALGALDGREVLRTHSFPTCAAAALHLPIGSWSEVSMARGRLLGLFVPPHP